MEKVTKRFFSDAGHGWLSVKYQELVDLGIEDQISKHSYVNGKSAYLEEDVDTSIFFNAYEDIYGQKPKITEYYDGDESIIRSYAPFRRR